MVEIKRIVRKKPMFDLAHISMTQKTIRVECISMVTKVRIIETMVPNAETNENVAGIGLVQKLGI